MNRLIVAAVAAAFALSPLAAISQTPAPPPPYGLGISFDAAKKALAALFLFIGYALQRRIKFLARASIPAPAIGGLLFAALILFLHTRGTLDVTIDTSLRAPLQTAFFTTIGLSATTQRYCGGTRLSG